MLSVIPTSYRILLPRLTIGFLFSNFFLKLLVFYNIKYNIYYYFFTNILLFIVFQLFITTSLTMINKNILVNDTYFIFKKQFFFSVYS